MVAQRKHFRKSKYGKSFIAGRKISFLTDKKFKRPVKVSFRKSSGEKANFWGMRTVSKPIKVSFYTKRKK